MKRLPIIYFLLFNFLFPFKIDSVQKQSNLNYLNHLYENNKESNSSKKQGIYGFFSWLDQYI